MSQPGAEDGVVSLDGALCTLEVETDDRSGLLFTLARALSNQKVSVER